MTIVGCLRSGNYKTYNKAVREFEKFQEKNERIKYQIVPYFKGELPDIKSFRYMKIKNINIDGV